MSAFDWEAFIDVAEELMRLPGADRIRQEARHRSAVSRAYYAAFHVAQAYIEEHALVRLTKTGRDHNLISETLQQQPDKRLRFVGQELATLKDARQEADYSTDSMADTEEWTAAGRDAVRTVREVISILHGTSA